MPQSFFIWKGKDCRSMGIVMRGPAPIVRPEERVQHVQIPGVSGDMTETEGENIYNSYIHTVSMSVRGGFRVREVYRWLRGEGYLTLSGEPDKRQKARVIGAITLNKVSRNLDNWAGEVQFYCQPLKELLTESKVTVTSTGASVVNTGDVNCRPLYKITTSGTSISLGASGTGTPASNTMTATGLTSGVVYWIDAETMEVWNADKSATVTEKSAGEFPVLAPGTNTLTFSGISSIEITKRERFL